MSDEPIYSFATFRNRLTVTGDLLALTALRVGAGRSIEAFSNDLPVLRDARDAPFIPGASLKGAFRARTEALIRTIAPKQALDLPEIEAYMRDTIAPLREEETIRELRQGGDVVEADRRLSEAIWRQSTMIDLTFGAPWIAGRLFFKDAAVDHTIWFNQYERRNGVALNRDTETVQQGLLYDYEVVPAGISFRFTLVLENAEDWQLGMVLLALKPWERGEVQIGGFRSRGLGYVQLVDVTYHYNEIRPGNVDDLLKMLSQDASGSEIKSDGQRAALWYAAFRDELRRVAQSG